MQTNDHIDGRPSFLITIDTEGDDGWARGREAGTENARFLPRFQALCERHGLRPTYLTNYEMATSPVFREFGRDALARGAAEVGMHLHAWNSPPIVPLTADDCAHMPYLVEYPEAVMREKVRVMTETLEETFGVKMTSHRAGRWALDSRYARLLVEFGYTVDCSVTPHVSWRETFGDPSGRGGTDYAGFPELPYRVDLEDISREGDSPLLEVPVTIYDNRRAWKKALPRRVRRRLSPDAVWLRPDGRNLRRMLEIIKRAAEEERPCVEFMLHSSELMPGGSPYFTDERAVERLYEQLEQLFGAAADAFKGATLQEFQREYSEAELRARAAA